MKLLDDFLADLENGSLVGLFTWVALLIGAVAAVRLLRPGRRRRARYVRGAANAPGTWRGRAAVGRRDDDESVTG